VGGGLRPSILAAAVIVGLILRLGFALGYWVDKPLTRDETEYLSLARSLAAGDGFVYDEVMRSGPVDPFGRAPGYPAFLALVGAGRVVPTSVPTSVKVGQSVVGALGVLLVGLIAGRLGGTRSGHAAAWLAAGYPSLVWVPAYALSEGLFWPLGLAVVWAFDHATDYRGRPAIWRFAACGVLTGLAVLVRPGMILFVPLAVVLLAWRRRPLAAAVFVLGWALVMTPWTARNYAHYDRFVLVASDGGVTFWTGNHPAALGEGDMAANPRLKAESLALRARHPGLTEEDMEPIYYREALGWIGSHPVDWLMLEFRKVFYLIVPIGPSYSLHSTRYVLASVTPYILALPAAVLGAWLVGVRRRRVAGLWLLLASAVLTALIFFPQERFRIPIIDPALVICAGVTLAHLRKPGA
jgi:4-amino-4-deoxy-L-arabinose transferase-like glycosyltransferase